MFVCLVFSKAAGAQSLHFFLAAVPGPLVDFSTIEAKPIWDLPNSFCVPVCVLLVLMFKCELLLRVYVVSADIFPLAMVLAGHYFPRCITWNYFWKGSLWLEQSFLTFCQHYLKTGLALACDSGAKFRSFFLDLRKWMALVNLGLFLYVICSNEWIFFRSSFCALYANHRRRTSIHRGTFHVQTLLAEFSWLQVHW